MRGGDVVKGRCGERQSNYFLHLPTSPHLPINFISSSLPKILSIECPYQKIYRADYKSILISTIRQVSKVFVPILTIL